MKQDEKFSHAEKLLLEAVKLLSSIQKKPTQAQHEVVGVRVRRSLEDVQQILKNENIQTTSWKVIEKAFSLLIREIIDTLTTTLFYTLLPVPGSLYKNAVWENLKDSARIIGAKTEGFSREIKCVR